MKQDRTTSSESKLERQRRSKLGRGSDGTDEPLLLPRPLEVVAILVNEMLYQVTKPGENNPNE